MDKDEEKKLREAMARARQQVDSGSDDAIDLDEPEPFRMYKDLSPKEQDARDEMVRAAVIKAGGKVASDYMGMTEKYTQDVSGAIRRKTDPMVGKIKSLVARVRGK